MAKFNSEGLEAYDFADERGYERMFVSEVETNPCAVCKEATGWYNIAFGAPICSSECQDRLWTEYFVRVKAEVAEVREWQAQGKDPEVLLEDKIDALVKEDELLSSLCSTGGGKEHIT